MAPVVMVGRSSCAPPESFVQACQKHADESAVTERDLAFSQVSC
jgi:hypothetical protein